MPSPSTFLPIAYKPSIQLFRMEESRVRDVVKKNSKALTQILEEACEHNTAAMEKFLRFTLNEANDERQIASSKKFVYDIAIVVINAMMEMVQEERESAA